MTESEMYYKKYLKYKKKYLELKGGSVPVVTAFAAALIDVTHNWMNLGKYQQEQFSVAEYQKLILAAVNQNGNALWHVKDATKAANKEIVFQGILHQNNKEVFVPSNKLIPHSLRGDIDIIIAAVTQNGEALRSISFYGKEHLKHLTQDNLNDIALRAFAQTQYACKGSNSCLQQFNLPEGIKQLIAQANLVHDTGNHIMQSVLTLVKQDGRLLGVASKELQKNRDVVLVAVKNQKYERVLMIIDPTLRKDPEIVRAAIAQNPKTAKFQ